jgi:hypothetical protein
MYNYLNMSYLQRLVRPNSRHVVNIVAAGDDAQLNEHAQTVRALDRGKLSGDVRQGC